MGNTKAFIRQEQRVIKSMREVIQEAKRNAKSIIAKASERILEAKRNIASVN